MVTVNGGERTAGPLPMPSWPVASLFAGIALGVLLLVALQTAFLQPGPWPLPLVLGPACLFLAAAAAATVPVITRPADRAERALRGLVAVTVPVVPSMLLYEVSTGSALAVVLVPVLIVSAGVVVAGCSGGQQAALPETGRATMAPIPVGSPGSPVEPLPPLCRLFKRSVDVGVAGAVLVLALPVLAFAAVAIAADGRGGVLFTQTRVGCSGRRFRMHKLRTMRPANDEGEHQAYVADLICGQGRPQDGMYKLVADDRRTRVGPLLRSLSIDELPQLWNVLRGDMSIVGPRPPLPAEVALYDEAAWARMAAKPGLTGLWQVSGRSRLSFQEMVELDVRYWQEWTPLLELRILLRTPKAVLWGRETA